jgi:hypothetical protein
MKKILQATVVGGSPIRWIWHWLSAGKEKSIVKFVNNKNQKNPRKIILYLVSSISFRDFLKCFLLYCSILS